MAIVMKMAMIDDDDDDGGQRKAERGGT